MNRSNDVKDLQDEISKVQKGEELDFYINNAYADFPFFMKSVTWHDSITYTYFGDVQKNLYYISDNMRDDFGFESNLVIDLLNEWRKRIFGEKWKKAYDEDYKKLLKTKYKIHDLYYQVKNKYGKVFWIRCCGDMEWDESKSKPVFFAGRVTKQSDFFIVDPVTNFPIGDTLQKILNERQSKGESFWTIGFCLNQMSKINTLHGNTMGNQLIRNISYKLIEKLGDVMTFYRLPGVRCMAVADTDIKKDDVVDTIYKIIEDEYRNFGLVVDIPSSLVAMRFPQKNWSVSEFQENMVALIKLAFEEKKRHCIINTEENVNKIHAMSNLSMTIAENVLNNMVNFRVVVQPVVNTDSGEMIGGETLMRWKYNNRDISPEVFIPILEKDRMIQIAGRWVFEKAVKVCSEIVKEKPDFYLTVNVSLQQLYDNDLVPLITSLLKQYNLSGNHIVIEMTESCMDNEPGKLIELINVCKKNGIRLALDDFGTGYSSLRVLMKYPIDIIKMDRSLLLELEESSEKNEFITNLVHACHQFGKKICVEGVETAHQYKLVKQGSGDMIQGFYFYKPTEIQDLYKDISKEKNK